MLGEADLVRGPLVAGRADGEHDGADRRARRATASCSRSAPPAGRACARRSSASLAGILDEGLEPQAAVDRPRFHPGRRRRQRGAGRRRGRAGASSSARGRHGAPLAGAPPLLRRRQRWSVEAGDGRRPAAQRSRAVERCDAATSAVAGSSTVGPSRRAATARARRLDVARDLRRPAPPRSRRRALVAQPLPELDDEPPAVEVALEVEQERLDPPLAAAVVRVRADRDRRPVAERRAGVDPVRAARAGRGSSARFAVGKPSVPPRGSPATTTPSTSGGRPSSLRGAATSPSCSERADPRRRDAVDARHRRDVEAEPLEQLEVAAPRRARSGSPRPRRRPRRRSRAGSARRTPPARAARARA